MDETATAPPRKRTRSAILQERRSLFPTLYDSKTDDEIEQVLDEYVVESEAAPVVGSDDDGASPPSLDLTPPPVDPDPAADTISSSADIWGRHPPKEYSSDTLICTICQQKVGSSLRYASHLDKCLGIGTMSRGGNNSATSAAILNKS
jgi:Sgf11 (transcriptional regulation protein)